MDVAAVNLGEVEKLRSRLKNFTHADEFGSN